MPKDARICHGRVSGQLDREARSAQAAEHGVVVAERRRPG
jgi:hypothetical protein